MIRTYETYETDVSEFSIVMEYPDERDILTSFVYYDDMESCWQSTLNEGCEYGFPIYLKDGKIEAGEHEHGDVLECPDEPGEIVVTTVTYTYEDESVNPAQEGAQYLIGLFHTHPPVTGCDGEVKRKLGPSSEDKEEIKNYEIIVPGFVYDYKDDSFNYIYGGHDKYLNSKVYTYGVEKRNYALDTYSGDFFD